MSGLAAEDMASPAASRLGVSYELSKSECSLHVSTILTQPIPTGALATIVCWNLTTSRAVIMDMMDIRVGRIT